MASPFNNPVFKRAAERILPQEGSANVKVSKAPRPKRGADVFVEDGAPQTWDQYVGQEKAKGLLRMAVKSAQFRDARLDHILIATGVPGAGKTTLARLCAFEYGAGVVETQGAVSAEEAVDILSGMHDGDVWFIDEIHQLVQGGKAKAEWLLAYLQDGVILTSEGEKKLPDVTIIGATTDSQMLPETILQRFVLKPVIEEYTEDEAAQIALGMSKSIFSKVGMEAPSLTTCGEIARAANNSPRTVKALMSLLRDAQISGMAERNENGDSDLTQTLSFAGVTPDGLDTLAQNYLAVLLVMCAGLGSSATIAAQLGESVVPKHTEKMLLQKGFIEITGQGRKLTEYGSERAMQLVAENS